jgi:hypothetical protein
VRTGGGHDVTQEDFWVCEKKQTSTMFRLPNIIPRRSAYPHTAEILLSSGLSDRQQEGQSATMAG